MSRRDHVLGSEDLSGLLESIRGEMNVSLMRGSRGDISRRSVRRLPSAVVGWHRPLDDANDYGIEGEIVPRVIIHHFPYWVV